MHFYLKTRKLLHQLPMQLLKKRSIKYWLN